MARTPRPAVTSRSEHWLRVLINHHPQMLDARISQAFGWQADGSMTWLSPLRTDDHAEYRDQAFLDRLGVYTSGLLLEQFWPHGGPRWDGLGIAPGNRPLLVEAKAQAYVEEANTSSCGATKSSSLALIHQSLNQLKAFLRSSCPHDWASLFYQYTNRLAHLYFLRELNSVDAYLVFVYFVNAPDVPPHLTTGELERRGANRLQHNVLGLPRRHRLSPYVAELFIDVNDLLVT